jgi:predicted O-linked N-acetylglucosamine transferase (SPINDLY family)
LLKKLLRSVLGGPRRRADVSASIAASIETAIEHYNAGAFAPALAICDAWLARSPDRDDLLHFAGRLLLAMEAPADAAARLEQAVAADPGNTLYWTTLALARARAGAAAAALAAARTAREKAGDDAARLRELAQIFRDLGADDEAETGLVRALELQPDVPGTLSDLALVYKTQGRQDEALALLQRAVALEPASPEIGSNLLLTLNCVDTLTPEAVFQAHAEWGGRIGAPLASGAAPHANGRDPERLLLVGFLSPDFRQHSVAYFAEPLIAHLDRSRYRVACYYTGAQRDATTARFAQSAELWRDLPGTEAAAIARAVRADGVDVLVDLAGHTSARQMQVMAQRPAPVQVTWLGYPNTTGLRTIDIRITDAIADPPGTTESLYTERLARLPEGFLCYQPPDAAPAPTRDAATDGAGPVFGCFNNLAKITPELVRRWGQILLAVPASRLVVKAAGLQGEGAVRTLRARFADAGVDPARVALSPWQPTLAGHLETYRRIDVALDTYPYHGTTTTFEALWMGVPVVTLAGRTHASRVGASILFRLGLPELVTSSAEAYVARAVALARDTAMLAGLRATLRDRLRASALTDGARFARAFETALREAWADWCRR